MAKVKVIVIKVEKDGEYLVLKVVRTGNSNDVQIEEGDEIEIEVPGHAPPPENP